MRQFTESLFISSHFLIRQCAVVYASTLVALLALTFTSPIWADAFSNAEDSEVQYSLGQIQASMRCKDLVSTSNSSYTVVSATVIPARDDVPAHCRVDGLIPTEVRFEANLPLTWNGRLYMFGNGGLAGTPAVDPGKQASRDAALQHHFVTAYTDTGHDKRVTPGGTFAHNNFHRLIDYGFRAVHLTVSSTKAIARQFYEHAVDYSYWNGCSTGGRQAMISAQRFPQDFDGIIAGAPAADYSGLKFSQAARVTAISNSDLDEAEINELARHIYQRCDGLDGIEDGLLSDPRLCDFDSQQHLPKCQGDDTTACFSEQELAALADYYAPVKLAGEEVYPAMPVGSEVTGSVGGGAQRTGWYPWLFNDQGPVLLDLLGSDFFRYMVFVQDNPDFDWTEFDFATEPDNLEEFRAIVDAVDTDLKAFNARGGKLLSYFGWADPDINPLTLLDYHERVRAGDADADDYFRVFMMPGMFHCRGGAGPDRFDAMTPLINWVEADQAPEKFDTWRAGQDNQRLDIRPTCAHPQRAHQSVDGFICK